MNASTAEGYRTVRQLADELGVSKWTIYRLYKEWPHSEVGGGIKFSPDDVADIKIRIHVPAPEPTEKPRYTPAQLSRAAKRLGLPAQRTAP